LIAKAAGVTPMPVMKHTKKTLPWGLAVYVLVRDAKGQVLLLRRCQTRGHFAGCWELPGGKPAPEETFDSTALVEVFEETGLEATLSGVAGAVDGSIPGVRVAMLILEGRTRSTRVTLSDEHDDFAWLPLEEVCTLKLRPGFDRFFASYVRHCAEGTVKRSPEHKPRPLSPRSRVRTR